MIQLVQPCLHMGGGLTKFCGQITWKGSELLVQHVQILWLALADAAELNYSSSNKKQIKTLLCGKQNKCTLMEVVISTYHNCQQSLITR